MPLKQSKSPKAFEHNVKAEMHAGKPQKQALAIAYSVKRKNAHKKASGGAVKSGSRDMDMAHGGRMMKAEGGNISASNEKRPMPQNEYNDSKEISKNRGNKPPKDDNWLDQPTVRQAQNNSGRMVKPIKRPKMVPTDAFSTKLYDQEGNLEESAKPGPYGEQPERDYDEEGPNRQGPKVPDMEDEHSTHAKPYAKGGQIQESDRHSHNIDHRTEMEPMDDEMQEHERMAQNDHEMHDSPSEDEGSMLAHELDEEGQDRQGPPVPDMEDEHSTGRKPYARGGSIQYEDAMDNLDDDTEMNPAYDHYSEDDSEMQPEQEEMEERHNSIAAAIMAKMHADKEDGFSGSDDMEDAVFAAEGGEILKSHEGRNILSHRSIYSDDSDQADLRRNAEEDANGEDQLSYNALEKENYDESSGLDDLDSPMDSAQHGDDEEMDSHDRYDMVDRIRSKMKRQKQF